ncbi:MAG: NTP transferase domain-containing protein [Microthrixaceae bacterium]
MADSLAGIVLAAGAGTRLAPLTDELPKALCPLGDRPLLDHALAELGQAVQRRAVNVHHGAPAIETHLRESPQQHPGDPVHLSHERAEALGTAGAVGALRGWLEGSDLVVLNADTWLPGTPGEAVSSLLGQWDRERVAVLTGSAGEFGPRSSVLVSALPWTLARELPERPAGLWEAVWRSEVAAGRLQGIHSRGVGIDCGTPGRYLLANRLWGADPVRYTTPAEGRHTTVPGGWVHQSAIVDGAVSGSVVGAGVRVDGTVDSSVLWPGAQVHAGEHLTSAIRTPQRTVYVRTARRRGRVSPMGAADR